MKKALGIAALGLILTTSGYALSFSLKLTGGGAFITSGDFNKGMDGANGYYAASYQNVSGRFSPLRWGMDFDLEFMMDITPRFGLGLGVGYLRVGHKADAVEYDWNLSIWTFHDRETLAPRVSAIPITLNVYLGIPLAGINLRGFAGVGCYFSGLRYDSTYHSGFLGIGYDLAFSGAKTVLGFQGGLSLDIPLGGALSFVLDVAGRYVSMTDIQGDFNLTPAIFGLTQPTQSGTDYFFWYYERDAGGLLYPMVEVGRGVPSGVNTRHGDFDLSGVSARAGLKVHF